jgi:hypothetical protein
MEKGTVEITQGLLDFLFVNNLGQPIEYKADDFYWISYPQGRYKATRLTREDVNNALVCNLEKDGDYDLSEKKCIPREPEE